MKTCAIVGLVRALLPARGVILACGLLVAAGASRCPAQPGPTGVALPTDRTIAEVGRTRMVAFTLAPAPGEDRVLDAAVEGEGVLEVVAPPSVLAGQTVGYARVRGLAPGEAVLRIGGAPIRIAVVEPRAPASRERIEIGGPAEGAAVFGAVAVGVRFGAEGVTAAPTLILPDGRVLGPAWQSPAAAGPRRHAMFDADFSGLAPGPATLTAVLTGPGGEEVAQRRWTVRVVRPDPAGVTAGEAEDRYEVERPKRFEQARRPRGLHPLASGGAYFDNAGAFPAVCFPVDVAEAGWHQVFVRASGTLAGGAMPTVGVVIDGAETAATSGRVLAEVWHRIAVGVPVRLEAGRRVITPFFENDFYTPDLADRNLRLDTIEVVRLGPAGTAPGVGNLAAMIGSAPMSAAVPTAAAADDPPAMRPGVAMAGAAMAGSMGSAPGAGEWSMPAEADTFGAADAPLRLALVQPLDGLPVSGALEIDAFAWWPRMEGAPPPMVTLLINGRAVGRQRAGGPRFWIDAAHFTPGENTVQLTAALPSGARASTPAQRVGFHGPASGDRPRLFHRFSVQDEAWDGATRAALRREHWPREGRAAGLMSNGRLTLALPDTLAGAFDLHLELRGDTFEGEPIARAWVLAGESQTAVGEVRAPAWWDTRRVGEAALAPGAKSLAVEFTNDRYEAGKGDRNLWVQAVILAERHDTPDTTPPVVEVLYPRPGHAVAMQDALVARVADDRGVERVELLLDGRPTGIGPGLALRPGLVVLPLLLRHVEPGPHTVALRARDAAGNEADSGPVSLEVAGSLPAPGPYARAVTLLDRFAFGPDPRALADILVQGERAWLEGSLRAPADAPGDAAALGAALARFPNRASDYDVPRRALTHAVLTPNPARARVVLWAQNHFSTWVRKAEAPRKWDEHVAFARLGAAPFPDLLAASATSPAMLRYLDQEQSFARRLNENYAREVMELHTLGVDGGYTQADVTALARLLTGWTSAREGDGRGGGSVNAWSHAFDGRLSEPGAQRLLGMDFPACPPAGRHDRAVRAFELLAARPETARFVCRKLAEHYAAMPAPAALVEDLARVFEETHGDLGAVLQAMASHPAFWAAAAEPRLAPPLDFGLRLCRATGHLNPWELGDFLQRSSAGLFDRPTPDGYPPQDSAYADSNAMVQRWRFAEALRWPLTACIPERWRWPADPLANGGAQRVIDTLAVRITGRVPGEDSNRAALQLAAGLEGRGAEALQALAVFIASTPEASER